MKLFQLFQSKTLLEMKVTTRGTPVQVCDRFLSYFKEGTRGDGGSSKLLFHLIIALIVLVNGLVFLKGFTVPTCPAGGTLINRLSSHYHELEPRYYLFSQFCQR